jgi:hypothetical protein
MLILSYRKSFSWKAFAKERDLLPSGVWELGDADLFLLRVSVLERICQGEGFRDGDVSQSNLLNSDSRFEAQNDGLTHRAISFFSKIVRIGQSHFDSMCAK